MAAKKSSINRGKGQTSAKNTKDGFKREIVLLLILALSVILFISVLGFGGAVGEVIQSVSLGVFGLMAYVFPVCLFLGTAFFISNRQNSLIVKKMVAGFCAFFLCCGLLQLLTEGYMKSTTLLDYYHHASENRTGGGIVGGAICMAFSNAFGVVGAYVLIVVFLIIAVILVTQRSFFGFLERIWAGIRSLVKRSKEKKEAVRPMREERSKARDAERQFRLEARAAQKRSKAVVKDFPKEQSAGESESLPRRMRSGTKSGAFMEGTQLIPPGMPVSVDDQRLPKEAVSESPAPFPEETRMEEEEPAFSIHRSEPPVLDELPQEVGEESLVQQKASAKAEVSGGKNPRSSKEEIQDGIRDIQAEIQEEPEKKREYLFPPLSLLKKPGKKPGGDSDAHLRETAKKLTDTFHSFGVNVTITNVSCGPSVTRYELQPEQGVKVSRIVGLSDDIKLNLAAADIRIEAPIPGKAAVGIEVPNKENSAVMLRELLQSPAFLEAPSKLAFAAGKDIAGQPVVADIAKMPHLLIAGATGSGKSVCINTLIMSILYKASPEEVKLIMIDPKVVELSVYNGIPHLYIPVVTDPKKAAGALNWAVAEMTDRYNLFAEYNVRNLSDYNAKLAELPVEEGEESRKKLPQIVIIVDELADLMMVAPGEVEDAICRLAQLARAAGIHLIIATQRPSVNVITGLIKANMPSRIAFAVSSGVDSRTILDMNGAEKLLGKGDMLFYPQGYPKPARLQGAFVSDEEVSRVVEFLADKNPFVEYSSEIEQKIKNTGGGDASGGGEERDVHFAEAGRFIIEKDKASIGMLQRMFKIGFNRAARIMDQLSEAGVVGPEEGTKPRKILMTMEEFENYVEESL